MTTKSTESEWRLAKETFLYVEGARAAVPQTRIVRNRHTGQLAEVALAPSEAPFLDEGDEGTWYTVVRGERYPADYPPCVARPAQFHPCSPP